MAKAGNVDYDLSLTEGDFNMPLNQFYFAEDQARYIISTSNQAKILELANELNIQVLNLGKIK